jgi:hypothetical protein
MYRRPTGQIAATIARAASVRQPNSAPVFASVKTSNGGSCEEGIGGPSRGFLGVAGPGGRLVAAGAVAEAAVEDSDLPVVYGSAQGLVVAVPLALRSSSRRASGEVLPREPSRRRAWTSGLGQGGAR